MDSLQTHWQSDSATILSSIPSVMIQQGEPNQAPPFPLISASDGGSPAAPHLSPVAASSDGQVPITRLGGACRWTPQAFWLLG